jgi:hypothetical protein
MAQTKIDLSKVPLTKKRAVEAVNAGQALLELPEDKRVSKFDNVQAATTGVQEMQAQLREKFGHAELYQDDDGGALSWITDAASEPAAPAPAQPVSASTEKRPAVGKTNIDMAQRLTTLKPNPKRPESKAWKIFDCYSGAPTGTEFVAKVEALGYSRGDALANIHYDLARGFIRIGDETAPQERAAAAEATGATESDSASEAGA